MVSQISIKKKLIFSMTAFSGRFLHTAKVVRIQGLILTLEIVPVGVAQKSNVNHLNLT